MAKSKAKTVFFCKECGYETPKWMGQCPGCHQWNTMTEEKVSPMSKGTGKRGDNLPRQELTGLFEVSMEVVKNLLSEKNFIKEKRQTPLRGMHKNNMIYVQHVIENKKLKKSMKKKLQNPLLLQ